MNQPHANPQMQRMQSLPSVDQTMLMAIAYVQHTLEHLVLVRREDEEWDERDFDVDLAMGLALAHVRLLRAELPLDRSTFDNRWFMAGAAVNLSVRTFSRPDSPYFYWLTDVQRQFETLAELVEFVDLQERDAQEARHAA